MRKVLWAFASLIVVVLGGLGGVLAFDAPAKPPPLASISEPFVGVDFSDLPTVQTYTARDGTKLGYRVYEGSGAQVVVLIHGSSDDGAGMHPLAKALRDSGASVYVPVVRGHGNFGRNGDIDYIGHRAQIQDGAARENLHGGQPRPVPSLSPLPVFVPVANCSRITYRARQRFQRLTGAQSGLDPDWPKMPSDYENWTIASGSK
jgi:hypothetical protein